MTRERIKWISGLLLVFFVILATNLIVRGNFNKVRDSIVTIYEDRLVVKDLIFKIEALLEEKHMALVTNDWDFYGRRNLAVNAELEELLRLFWETRLTEDEERTLRDFNNQLTGFMAAESGMKDTAAQGTKAGFGQRLNSLKAQVRTLSDIQLNEGRRQLFIGSQAIRTSELLLQVELIGLVILALIIQYLVMVRPRNQKQGATGAKTEGSAQEPEEKIFRGRIT